MILDHISNYKKYINLHPSFAAAFKFLNELEVDAKGSFPINGKELFASVTEIKGRGYAKAKLEAHTQYIDIQYIMTGTDYIGWANTNPNDPGTEYDQENDYRFVDIKPTTLFELPNEHFVIFFPEDAHAPLAGNEMMKKVFMKVKI